MVSIITPTYNSSKFISETINSVISQTYKDWEMIIVDDCSIDNTVKIILEYVKKDNRIILITLSKNVGAAEARNVALRKAKGRFIAFLDSDDLWNPNKLQKQINFMMEKKIAFSFSSYERITENGDFINTINVPEKITYKQFLRNTIIGTLTVMIDKEKTGYFEMPLIKSSHDMALWCILFKRGFVAFGIQEVTARYREVNTSNTAKKWKAAKDVWRVYRRYEKLNLLQSIYFFIGYAFNATIKRIL